MQQRPWLYYFVDGKTGKTFRKEMGLAVSKVDRKPIRYSPDGWQEIKFGWERNLDTVGVGRNFSLPLGFVFDAADILRWLFYNRNVEQVVHLLIQKQYLFIDPTNYYFYYDLFYKGELDFSTTVDGETKVQISIMEGALTKDLKANENTKYEIPVDEIWVRFEGVKLEESGTFQMVDNLPISKSVHTESFVLPIIAVGSEDPKPGLIFLPEQLEQTGNSVTYVNSSDNYFVKANDSNVGVIDVHIKGTLHFIATTNNLPFALQLRFMTSTMTTGNQNAYNFFGVNPVVGQGYDVPIDMTIPLQPGEKLFMRGAVVGGITGAIDLVFEFLPDSEFTISYDYRQPASFIRALFPLTLMKRLIAKITGDTTDKYVSSALLDQFRHLVITSGDAIRGLEGAVAKTSYSDFYKSEDAVLCAGWGIESGKIVLEGREYFLKNQDAIPLGKVKEPEQKEANDLMANTIKYGYQPQTYDDVNGRYEFNTEFIRSSPLKRVTKEHDLQSIYRADCYGATFTQINLAGKKTTDSNADNDIWFLNIDLNHPQTDTEHGTYYNLKRKTYDIITGVITPETLFNIEDLTPARMLNRHKAWLNGMFYGFDGSKLVLETSDKNRELYTKLGAVIFDEDADITITNSPRLFKTVTFNFMPETPVALVETMEANPNRCFSFIHPRNNRTYKGFNLNVGIAANTLEEQAFVLLSTDDNDLKTLAT